MKFFTAMVMMAGFYTVKAASIVPPDFSGAKQPQVAMTFSGAAVVVFGRSNAIYFTASTNGAKTFSPPVLIADSGRLSLGMRRGPRIVATEKELVTTAIIDGDLFSWSSMDNGQTWSKAVLINDRKQSAREGLHAMAAGRGKVFAVWLDLRSGQTELWGSLSTNAGCTWRTNQLIYKSPDGHICECCQPNVAITTAGKIMVMWRNWLNGARDLYGVASEDGGDTFIRPSKFGKGTWPLSGCPMDGGSLGFDGCGNPIALWRRKTEIYGSTGGSSEYLVAKYGTQPVLGRGVDGIYYLWQEDGGVMAMKYQKLITRIDDAAYPSVTVSQKYPPIVVWEGKKSIFATQLP